MGVEDFLGSAKQKVDAFLNTSEGKITTAPARMLYDAATLHPVKAMQTITATPGEMINSFLDVASLGRDYVANPFLGGLAQSGIDPNRNLPFFHQNAEGNYAVDLGAVSLPVDPKVWVQHPGQLVENLRHPEGVTYKREAQIQRQQGNDAAAKATEDLAGQLKNTPNSAAAVDLAFKGHPIGKIYGQTILDPTMYLGGEGTAGLKLRGLAPEGSRAADLLTHADVGMEAYQRALGYPLKKAPGVLATPLRHTPWGDLLEKTAKSQATEFLTKTAQALEEKISQKLPNLPVNLPSRYLKAAAEAGQQALDGHLPPVSERQGQRALRAFVGVDAINKGMAPNPDAFTLANNGLGEILAREGKAEVTQDAAGNTLYQLTPKGRAAAYLDARGMVQNMTEGAAQAEDHVLENAGNQFAMDTGKPVDVFYQDFLNYADRSKDYSFGVDSYMKNRFPGIYFQNAPADVQKNLVEQFGTHVGTVPQQMPNKWQVTAQQNIPQSLTNQLNPKYAGIKDNILQQLVQLTNDPTRVAEMQTELNTRAAIAKVPKPYLDLHSFPVDKHADTLAFFVRKTPQITPQDLQDLPQGLLNETSNLLSHNPADAAARQVVDQAAKLQAGINPTFGLHTFTPAPEPIAEVWKNVLKGGENNPNLVDYLRTLPKTSLDMIEERGQNLSDKTYGTFKPVLQDAIDQARNSLPQAGALATSGFPQGTIFVGNDLYHLDQPAVDALTNHLYQAPGAFKNMIQDKGYNPLMSLNDTIGKLADEVKAANPGLDPLKVDQNAEQVQRLLAPTVTQNPDYFKAGMLGARDEFAQPLRDALAATDQQALRNNVGTTLRNLNQTFSAYSVEHPLFGETVGALLRQVQSPAQLAGVGKDAGKAFTDSALADENQLQMNKLYDIGRDKLTRRRTLTPAEYTEKAFSQKLQQQVGIIQQIQQKQIAAGVTDVVTGDSPVLDILLNAEKYLGAKPAAEFNKLLEDTFPILKDTVGSREVQRATSFGNTETKYLSAHQAHMRDAMIEQYMRMPFNAATAVNYREAMFDTARQLMPKEFNFDQKMASQFSKTYDKLLGMAREQALLSPRFLGANVLDMSTKVLLEQGPSALRYVLPGLFGERMGQTWMTPYKAVGREVKPLGIEAAHSRNIAGQVELATAEGTGRGSNFRFGGRTNPVSNVMEAWTRIQRAIEDSFRGSASAVSMEHHLQNQVAPGFAGVTEKLAQDAGVSSSAAQGVLYQMESKGYLVSPQDVFTLAHDATGDVTFASRMASAWNQGVEESVKFGQYEAQRIHFPIGDQRVIEDKIKINKLLTFSYWATRNLPYYAETLATHPDVLRAYINYSQAVNEERQQTGGAQRLMGKVALWSMAPLAGFLGTTYTAYLNPMVAFAIFDQGKDLGKSNPNQGMVSKILEAASSMGLSPAPWIPTATYAVGSDLFNFGTPVRFSRHSQLIADTTEGLTGHRVDVEAPLQAGQRAVRNALSPITSKLGGTPDQPISNDSQALDYNIQRILVERGLQESGDPKKYTAAMANPADPAYQQARQMAIRDRMTRGLWGFTIPMSLSTVSQGEQQIRQEKQQLKSLPADMQSALKNSPTDGSAVIANAYSAIPDNSKAAQVQSAAAYLRNARGTSQAMPAPFPDPLLAQVYQLFPEYQNYKIWQSQQPAAAYSGLAAFSNAGWWQNYNQWVNDQLNSNPNVQQDPSMISMGNYFAIQSALQDQRNGNLTPYEANMLMFFNYR